MRAFVHFREMLVSHADLARRIDELEQRYDGTFTDIFDAIRELATPTASEQRARIGFVTAPESRGRAPRASQNRTKRKWSR